MKDCTLSKVDVNDPFKIFTMRYNKIIIDGNNDMAILMLQSIKIISILTKKHN